MKHLEIFHLLEIKSCRIRIDRERRIYARTKYVQLRDDISLDMMQDFFGGEERHAQTNFVISR